MKKLMVALAAIALAGATQAASFNWSSTTAAYGVNASSVTDNGDYAAGTTLMNKKGTYSVILALYDSSTSAFVGQSASTAVKYSTTGNKFKVNGIEVSAAEGGKTYNYVLTITGTQDDLTARGVDGAYDYSAATLTTTISGSVESSAMGAATLSSAVPTTWTISGIAPVPEPTSGLLMLVGLGALALRRRRA